jgi:riboflavin kinase/FMN adenylyltransferase
MRIIEDLTHFPSDIHTVVTSGTFDGVHLGHRKILQQLVARARKENFASVITTYWPHPRFVLGKGDSLRLLSTFEEKAALMAETGIDFLVRIPFTEQFSQLEPDDFLRDVLLEPLNMKRMVIGYDHHFGKDRKGNFQYLKENAGRLGFEVEEIPRHDIDDVGVSSTKIRNALINGQVAEAATLLGRPYQLLGKVIKGDALGRTIGYPTANIWVPEAYKLIPADGVYAVEVACDGKRWKGMSNIGHRPTVDGLQKRIEVHIFNFDKEIYGEDLALFFHEKLRNEMKFENMEALKAQLSKDEDAALAQLKDLHI